MQIHWKPTPKQEEALVRTEFEILFGGARGGGKTDAGQAWLLYDKENPLYKGLVIRKNSDDLSDWSERAKKMYAPTNALFTGTPPLIRFPKGSFVKTGHLKDANAYEKYQGHEYHKILIEELEQIPSEEQYLKLISSCRSTVPGLTPQVFCTANPGGKGNKWIKKRWRLSGSPKKPIITKDERTGRYRVFIPALVDDNPHIMENDPSYVHFLNGLPDGLREAWRLGSWDDVEIKGAHYGAMLTQARREGRVKLVPYDPALLVHTVWDLGMDDSMSIGFWQRTRDEIKIIDYLEDNNQGLPYYIKELKNKPYVYGKHFAPFDINQKELTTGQTRLETAKKLGIKFNVVPSVSIDDGIDKARLMFSRLWINELPCDNFIEAIRQYRKDWDEKNLKFKDNPVHDWTSHAADMFRYTALVENQMTNEQDNFDQVMQRNEQNYIVNPYI